MSERELPPEIVAILHTAIYYGVPSQGHSKCAQGVNGVAVTMQEPDIEKKHCVACGKPLIKQQSQPSKDESEVLLAFYDSMQRMFWQ